MSVVHEKSLRRILPRWRHSQRAASGADFQTRKPPQVRNDIATQLRDQLSSFDRVPNIGTAAELVSVALLAHAPELAEPAAWFILRSGDVAPKTLTQLARGVTESVLPFQSQSVELSKCIARTRELLRIQPKNPLLWSDMARHYASLGDRKYALRSMTTAYTLAPNHRWMLRAYSRFLIHQGDPLHAHKLLTNHPRTRQDPWLIAAELACAQVAGRVPKFWRQANDIIQFDRVAPIDMSELATAVAMMELEAGERKKARKIIKKGLMDPTENTLAQIFWAKEQRHLTDGTELAQLVRSANDAYEADYRLQMLNGDLLGAQHSAETWMNDEPFAARPCSEIAYVACLLDDHDSTIRMAARVKQLDGRCDPALELNAIFAKLSSWKFDPTTDSIEFERIKSKLLLAIEQADGNSYHAVANLGLWLYRSGRLEIGYETYQHAIEIALKIRHNEAAAMAATFGAREAILVKHPSALFVLQQARDLVGRSKNVQGEFYLRKLEALAQTPEKARDILSPMTAGRFLAPKRAKPIRLEHTKDGPVAWISRR